MKPLNIIACACCIGIGLVVGYAFDQHDHRNQRYTLTLGGGDTLPMAWRLDHASGEVTCYGLDGYVTKLSHHRFTTNTFVPPGPQDVLER